MPLWGYGAIFISALLVALLLGVLAGRVRTKTEFTYGRKKLLSEREQNLFQFLEECCGSGCRVLPKVRLCDFLTPGDGLSPKEKKQALDHLCTREIGFVLCSRENWRPLLAVELEQPATTSVGSRSEIEQACRSAGLPLFYLTGAKKDRDRVRSAVSEAIGSLPPSEGS